MDVYRFLFPALFVIHFAGRRFQTHRPKSLIALIQFAGLAWFIAFLPFVLFPDSEVLPKIIEMTAYSLALIWAVFWVINSLVALWAMFVFFLEIAMNYSSAGSEVSEVFRIYLQKNKVRLEGTKNAK